MGTIQNSVNQTVGTVASVAAIGKHISNQNETIVKQEEANKLAEKNNNLLEQQVQALNSPDYGRTMTNAEAEAKSIASLRNALYPGNKIKNIRNSYSDSQKAELQGLDESYQLALEKWREAALAYNYPGGKQMNRTLSSDPEEEANK